MESMIPVLYCGIQLDECIRKGYTRGGRNADNVEEKI